MITDERGEASESPPVTGAIDVHEGFPNDPSIGENRQCTHPGPRHAIGPGGSGVSAARAVSEADAAMALLREAIAMDFRAVGAYRTEEALDPLRDHEDFRLLMMDLAFPSDAFAAPR